MFRIFFAALFSGLSIGSVLGQNPYRYQVMPIPKEAGLISNFNVASDGSVLIPFKGGILSVRDTSWFISPNKEIYITSFYPLPGENGVYIIGNTKDSTELYYLNLSAEKKIFRLKIAALEKGIYNVIFKKNVCFVWGRNKTESIIGIIGMKGFEPVYKSRRYISQVQLNDSNEVYFSSDSSIFSLSGKRKVLSLLEPISGFCFDYKNRLIVSTSKTIALQKGKELEVIMSNLSGLLDSLDDSIFVLSNKRKRIYRLFPEEK